MAFFETLDRERYTDFGQLNIAFLEAVRREQPDLIFCVLMHYELWRETLDIAREVSQAMVINWATDDSWKYRQFSRLIAPHFDLYATTCAVAFAKAQQDGLDNFFLTQWAAAGAKLQEPLPATECRHAVSFVGSCYGNRGRWIEGLRQKGIAVECFGHGWKNGAVAAEEIPRIMRESAISLNFGDSERGAGGALFSRSRQIKARIFEVPGCGGFLMTQPAEGLERYYALKQEVATFGDLEDLSRQIGHYLTHPEERDRIARAGHLRTRSEHTYEIRFEQLLEAATAVRKRRRLAGKAAPEAAEADGIAALAPAGARHRVNAGLSLLRALLTAPCVALWGKERGPRAARRILFELSWRLCGATTYSAAGWPGRIFYRES